MLPYPLSNTIRTDGMSGIFSPLTAGLAASQHNQYVQSGLTVALLQLRPSGDEVNAAPRPSPAQA